jgi:hemoglobin/transferrin/lactoferrin receptor protein
LYSKFTDKTFFPFPYDDITQRSDAVTGNIGLIITPKGGWRIAALYASGFRTPNVDDITKVFESTSSSLIVPNPTIKPEKTANYEISLSKTFKNKYRIGATGWYTNYTNAITTDFGTLNGSSQVFYNGGLATVKTTVNANNAFVYGFSGNVAGDVTENISFSSVLNYTFGRIKESTGNYPLDHVAPLFGRTSITGKWGNFTGEVFALYNGKKDSADYNLRGEDNQIYSANTTKGFTPSWFTANIRMAYDVNTNFTIQVAAENILDKYYRVFASGLSAPGRNFVVTLRGRL